MKRKSPAWWIFPVFLTLVVVPPSAAFAEKEDATLQASKTVRVVGVLRETSTRRRLKDRKSEEVNHRMKVGHINLVPTDLDLKSMMQKLVVIEGVIDTEYRWPTVVHERDEDLFQARSDWILDEDGKLEVVRGSSPPIHTLRPEKVSVVEGFSIEMEGEDLVVVFENTLGVPLSDLTFSLFYEGCYGKPGTTKKVEEVGDMAVGGKKSIRFPLLDILEGREGPRRFHGADTFRIDAAAGGLYFDVKIFIPREFFPDMDPKLKGRCRK